VKLLRVSPQLRLESLLNFLKASSTLEELRSFASNPSFFLARREESSRKKQEERRAPLLPFLKAGSFGEKQTFLELRYKKSKELR
jgi:hypothetical protein